MAIEIKIPDLGENISAGTVASVLVKVGDTIELEQSLVELETDKAVLEVPADKAGVITEILVSEGDEVSVGQVICLLNAADISKKTEEVKTEAAAVEEKPAEVVAEAPTKTIPPANTTSEVVDIKIPELGENISAGTVASILVKAGDNISENQGLLELETDKAVLEVPSEVSGVVKEVLVKEGDSVAVGAVILRISGGTADLAVPEKQESPVLDTAAVKDKAVVSQVESQPAVQVPAATPAAPASIKDAAPAAPSVRRFSREIGIDINQVTGTGPSGRISIDDVKRFSKNLNLQRQSAGTVLPGVEGVKLPDFSKWGEIETAAMSNVRKSTAKHLSSAWATIPHVTQFDKADITHLEKMRKQFGKKAEKAGGKLTVTAILLKIVASALKVFPQFNASIDMSNNEIIYKKYFNIGLAVDTDRGLLVPVIRNVDQKNVIELAVELGEIAEKARNRKLSLEDMQGGNFSISNLGGIGGTGFTPIVNAPEVAILGVSRSSMEPVFVNGEFEPRNMLPLSLSYDHRIIDGADGARFLRWIVEALEEPFLLALEG